MASLISRPEILFFAVTSFQSYIILRIQRIELLIQPGVSRHASIDGAADQFTVRGIGFERLDAFADCDAGLRE
jgi:hypothetical protein